MGMPEVELRNALHFGKIKKKKHNGKQEKMRCCYSARSMGASSILRGGEKIWVPTPPIDRMQNKQKKFSGNVPGSGKNPHPQFLKHSAKKWGEKAFF